MILSVSKRTDIPAFYGEWFMNNLRKGSFQVRNPLYPLKVSQINFETNDIECIVFWTKNPAPFFKYLPEIEEKYNFYFTYSLNDYPSHIEKNLPDIENRVKCFQSLSKMIGSKKVVWRYDPILFTSEIGIGYHLEKFERLAQLLHGYTNICVVSIADQYARNTKNLHSIQWKEIGQEDKENLIIEMLGIAKKYDIQLQSCDEEGLESLGLPIGKCVDDNLISELFNINLKVPSQNERKGCHCVKSVDVGVYNTCLHDCVYCYANYSFESVKKNFQQHSKESLMLIGSITDEDNVTKKKVIRHKKDILQESFFDKNDIED